jgi:hypothetical protein
MHTNRQSACLLLFLLLPVFLAGMYHVTNQETSSNDVYWHIKMGERFVSEPFFQTDNFSFTYEGREISKYPYLFDVLVYYLDRWVGYDKMSSVFLYSSYILALIMALIYVWVSRAGYMVAALTIVGVSYFCSERLLIRPDLLFYPMIAIALILYRQCVSQFSVRSYLGLLAISILWANLHTMLFLYVILAGLYLDLAIKFYSERRGTTSYVWLILSGLLILTSEFITPFGQHSLVSLFSVDPRWKEHIIEYWNFFYRYSDLFDIYPLSALAAISFLLAIKTRSIGYLLIILVFVVQSIQLSRIIPFSGYLLLLLNVHMYMKLEKKPEPEKVMNLAMVLLIFSFGYLFVNKVWAVQYYKPTFYKPKYLVEYYKEQGYHGNIFNDYNLGGYLIYHLYPQSKVYIDGRTAILYNFAFFERHFALLSNEIRLTEEDEKYDIDYLIILNNSDFFLTAYYTGRYQLDYIDGSYALFKKGGGYFNYVGLLFAAPYCWNESWSQNILEEIAKNAPNINDKNFLEYLNSVKSYILTDDKTSFLESELATVEGDYAKRFFSYRSLDNGRFDLAGQYLSSMDKLKTRDFLSWGEVAYQEKNYGYVLDVINTVLNEEAMRFDDVDALLLHDLIEKMSSKIVLIPSLHKTGIAIERDLRQREVLGYLSGGWKNVLCDPEISLTGKYLNEMIPMK